MAKDKNRTTAIGQWKKVFQTTDTVVGLRRVVNRILVRAERTHRQAAASARVSRVYWSRMINSPMVTKEQLVTLAKGCGVTATALVAACKRLVK